MKLRMILWASLLLTGSLGSRAQAEHATILPAPQQISYGSGTLSLSGLPIRLSSYAVEEDHFAAQTLAECVSRATGSRPAILPLDRQHPGASLFLAPAHSTHSPSPAKPWSKLTRSLQADITTNGSGTGQFLRRYFLRRTDPLPDDRDARRRLPQAQVTDWPAMAYRGPWWI